MLKIGIECENIEDIRSRWGIGHMVLNLLREYSQSPELQSKFKLYLYFKKEIPRDLGFLENPIFIKKIAKLPGLTSFNIFYHILMPIRAMMDGVDWMFFPAYMLPPLYLGKSIVMLTNDVYYEYKFGQSPFRYKLAYRLFANWAAFRANKILAISESSKKELVKLFRIRPEKIFVSHLGIDDKATNQNYISEIAEKNNKLILYVGQMLPRRHAKETILAFKKLVKENPDFNDLSLILVGKDKYRPALIDKLIEQANGELGSNKIVHYDYIEKDEELSALYNKARLLVYISSAEAFGLPPMEAAILGTPIIVKDNDLNHELFSDSAFFIKNEKDIDEITKAMKEGLTNQSKREDFIESYKTLRNRFTWQNFTNQLFKIIEY